MRCEQLKLHVFLDAILIGISLWPSNRSHWLRIDHGYTVATSWCTAIIENNLNSEDRVYPFRRCSVCLRIDLLRFISFWWVNKRAYLSMSDVSHTQNLKKKCDYFNEMEENWEACMHTYWWSCEWCGWWWLNVCVCERIDPLKTCRQHTQYTTPNAQQFNTLWMLEATLKFCICCLFGSCHSTRHSTAQHTAHQRQRLLHKNASYPNVVENDITISLIDINFIFIHSLSSFFLFCERKM